MSHPKSVWKGVTKYVVPAPLPGRLRRQKSNQIWTEYRVSGKMCGWRGQCADCGRSKFATSEHNLHILSQSDGRCYACREIRTSENTSRARPLTVTEVTLKGNIPVPRPLTRDLASRGSGGHALHKVLDSRRFKTRDFDESSSDVHIHLGRQVKNRHDARYLSPEVVTAVRKKMTAYPFWSCCLQPVGKSLECPKSKANQAHVVKIQKQADEAKILNNLSRPTSRQKQEKQDRTRALLNLINTEDSSEESD